MPHHYGMRAKTRHMFARDFRAHGPEHLSTYLTIYKVGDWVDIKANGTCFSSLSHSISAKVLSERLLEFNFG